MLLSSVTESASALPSVGIPLGLLIGGLSGLLTLLFLRTLQIVRRETKAVSQLIAQFLGIPTLWLSVPFGSKLLSDVAPVRLMSSYLITLAVIWGLIVAIPLVRLVIVTGNEIGSDG